MEQLRQIIETQEAMLAELRILREKVVLAEKALAGLKDKGGMLAKVLGL